MVFHSGMGGNESGLLSSGTGNPLLIDGRTGALAAKARAQGRILSGNFPVEYILLPVLEKCMAAVLSLCCSIFASGSIFPSVYQFYDEAKCRRYVSI